MNKKYLNLAQLSEVRKIYYVDKNERYLLVFTSCIIEKNCNPFELKKEKKENYISHVVYYSAKCLKQQKTLESIGMERDEENILCR